MLTRCNADFQYCGYRLNIHFCLLTAQRWFCYFIILPGRMKKNTPLPMSPGSLVMAVLQTFPQAPVPPLSLLSVLFSGGKLNSCSKWRQPKDMPVQSFSEYSRNRDGSCNIERNVGQECVVGCGERVWVVVESL